MIPDNDAAYSRMKSLLYRTAPAADPLGLLSTDTHIEPDSPAGYLRHSHKYPTPCPAVLSHLLWKPHQEHPQTPQPELHHTLHKPCTNHDLQVPAPAPQTSPWTEGCRWASRTTMPASNSRAAEAARVPSLSHFSSETISHSLKSNA